MKILVIGSGGREHAICWALQRTSSERLQLFCAPGNAGIAQIAECVPVNVNDGAALASFAEELKLDLTMVGPEAHLAAALIDTLKSGVVGAEAARKILIEERLTGPEVSVLLFSDGKDFRLMPVARDHKRIGEGDTGPNTGGMGSITAAGIIDSATLGQVASQVIE